MRNPFSKRDRALEEGADFQGLPQLTDEINDNMYLASAAKAAEADKASGAYDEFLFSENNQTQMPFERAVDDHMNLVRLRLQDRGRRVFLLKAKSWVSATARMARIDSRLADVDLTLSALEPQITRETAVLSGELTGRHSLYWPETQPIVASITSGRFQIILPALIFILVGVIDLAIIGMSLDNLPGFKGYEAWILVPPAVGIQLVFPHLVGHRINLLTHGHRRKIQDIVEGLLLLGLWFAFLISLTMLRMTFINDLATKDKNPLTDELYAVLWVANLLMLLGLGSWLLFNSSRANPHQASIRKLVVRKAVLRRNHLKLVQAKAGVRAEIDGLSKAREIAEASYRDAIEGSGTALRDAAKSIYRRSLVNSFGQPEFTATFLQANQDVLAATPSLEVEK